MIKVPYKVLLVIGVLLEFTLLIFFDKKVAAYGPFIFWIIGLIVILNYGLNMFKLSSSVNRTKPKIFKKYSFGILITRYALSDENFLATLNNYESKLLSESRVIFRYFSICFVLFTLSALMIFLK